MSSNRPSRLAVAAAISVGLAVCSACGSSGGDAAGPSSPTRSSTTGAAASSFDKVAYCQASLAVDTDPGPQVDFASASEAEIAAGLKAYATDTLGPLVDDLEASAPNELDNAVAALRKATDTLAETGDGSVFDDPALAKAEATAHAFDVKTCGYEQVDAVATDYAFGGIAETYEPGPVSFEVSNEGKEFHEMIVLRIKDGVDKSASEILALPEAEARESVETMGMLDPLAPGDSDYVVVDLKPGRYIATCFLPKGATSMDDMESADGEPHAALGMVQEFTVA